MLHAGALTPGLNGRPLLNDLFDRLGSGMQLFFVISGYLIARSWRELDGRRDALQVFAVKRAAKILPLYLLVLHLNIGLYLALKCVAPDLPALKNSVNDANLTLANYAAHWFFLQGAVPGWINSLVDGSWSICAEVYFYLLFPLILYRLHRTLAGGLVAVALACAASLVATYLLRRSPAGFSYYNFLSQMPCLMMGALLYTAEAQPTVSRLLASHRGPILAGCIGLCAALWLVRAPGLHMVYAAVFAVALGAARALPGERLQGVALDRLQRIGQFSYALFFTHLILLKLQHGLLQSLWPSLPFAFHLVLNIVTGLWLSAIVAEHVLHPIDRAVVNAVRKRLATRAPADVRHADRQG